MTKVKQQLCCSHGRTMATPSKRRPTMSQHSPAQKEAKKVAAKYKRGYLKSPGKLQRIQNALKDIDNGSSVCKAAKTFLK